MPTYVYRRQDGTTFEIEQRMSEPRLTECPTTGQPVERLISGGTGLVFKGSGFYLTDYARKSGSPAAPSSDSTKESTKESTPAPKTADTTKSD
ncbi:MAG: zinc ribbon domain-containing protein [Rhodothermales bacterium]